MADTEFEHDQTKSDGPESSSIPARPANIEPPLSSDVTASVPPASSSEIPETPSSDRQQQRRGGRDRRQRFQRQPNPRHQQGGEGRQQQDPQQHQHGGKEISVVIPLFNEEQSLRELYDKIKNALHRLGRYEVIFIDDGSTDGSFRVLQELRNRERGRVKVIRFRRNYGKSAALSVGFQHAEGNFIVTLDADLQDDPNEIPNLIHELKKGFDLVSGWKKKRHDPISKTIPSRLFNAVTALMTGIKLHDFNSGIKGYRREVVKEVKVYGELHRYIPVLAHWEGYKIGEIAVQHHARKYGKTKFGIGRFWKGFLDLLTVLFTTRYMQRPLHLFGFWGMVFFTAGFLIDLYLGLMKIFGGEVLGNRPLFFGGILLIIVGIQFISVGLLGEMISKSAQTSDQKYSIREILR